MQSLMILADGSLFWSLVLICFATVACFTTATVITVIIYWIIDTIQKGGTR